MVGNILSPHDFDDSEALAMFRHHYNAVTAENAMKPVHISPAPNKYSFDKADRMVDWAIKNNIAMVGHTLVWHGQSAPWLNRTPEGEPLTRGEAKRNLESFIKAYAGRYTGRIYSWDVINEAFRDLRDFCGDWKKSLRQSEPKANNTSHWYLSYANGADAARGESGADYVFDAFRFARRYDPLAVLYYNDYNEDVPAKREAIACMVEDTNAQWRAHAEYDGRPLIEGIGMQSHHNHIHINLPNIRESIERFIKAGTRISITELDFTYGSAENPASPMTEEDEKAQAVKYRELFDLYSEFSGHIERVTFWGKNDGQSWRKWGSPVLFDGGGKAKASYWGLIG
jgi:GH35 family endo-1,4-beta-xylanase